MAIESANVPARHPLGITQPLVVACFGRLVSFLESTRSLAICIMEWLNYHHLFYFWLTVKSGTISAAAESLHLARPTVAAQIKDLEKSMGRKLFEKQGRGLVLTEFGKQVHQYAEEIFAIGHELREFIKTGIQGNRKRFVVGLPDVVPKHVAFELLKPALHMKDRPRTICLEGKLKELLADLALHKLDLVISDSPAPPTLDFKVYTHKLGQCGMSMLATPDLAKQFKKGFPKSLNDAPCLLPTDHTAVRRSLDLWMDDKGIFPEIVAEFEDSALLKVFGQAGEGIFPVPTAIEARIRKQYGVQLVGRIPEVLDKFYAISAEKRVQHGATLLVVNQARNKLFDV
jgi:LysR family transcriptional activator of nhaA